MTVAVPIWQQRISPLLDTASRLLVLKCRDGKEASRKEIVLESQPSEALARTLAALKLDLLLCSGISEALLRALQHEGVKVRPHLCGEVHAILDAFCRGQLTSEEFRMPGCHEAHASPSTPRNNLGVPKL